MLMPAATMKLPFNLVAWIEENLSKPLGGIGNKDVFEEDTDMIFSDYQRPQRAQRFSYMPVG
jgi:hypothetical protein